MSLTRPILLQITSFDATKQQTFKFNVSAGGAQIVANKLVIRDQTDNQIVYEAKQETFKYEHILPASTLVNGKYYNAVVTIFDAQGNESAPSLPIQFRCYTEPTLEITNMPSGSLINNSSYSFEFQYNQSEGERLNDYVLNLYDITQKLISTSGIKYVPNGTPPFNGSYLFTSFVDDTGYYIEIVGTTINGAKVTTGKIQFNVDYNQPDLFTLLELDNNCDGGYITVASNIVLIDGVAQPEPPVFIEGKEIDLKSDGAYVAWPQGYSVSDDFLARAWFRDPNVNSTILTFANTRGQSIQIDFLKGYENIESPEMKAYAQAIVTSIEGMEYYIVSNYVDIIPNTDYYNLQLERVNGLYAIQLQTIKEV